MNSRDYAYTVSLAAGGILAAGLIFYFIWGKEFVAVPACIIYRTAGIWCPACGGTRAVLALLRGELMQSFLYHPIVPYSVLVYTAYLLEETRERVLRSSRRVPLRFWKGCVLLGLFPWWALLCWLSAVALPHDAGSVLADASGPLFLGFLFAQLKFNLYFCTRQTQCASR